MKLARGNRFDEQWSHRRHDYRADIEGDWMTTGHNISGYEFEDELVNQLAKLPSEEDVDELMSALRVSALRQFSAGVVNGAIAHIKANGDQLENAKLINSWVATAEETVAAGRNHIRIAARRK